MKTVTVNASVRYDVLIEKGLLSHCGEKTAEVFSPQKSAAAIITDDNVSALYLNTPARNRHTILLSLLYGSSSDVRQP